MNIVLINHYAGSERMGMEYRPFYLAREWAAEGHNVTIVAASFSHLRSRQPTVRVDLECTEEEGATFRWLRTNRYHGNGGWRVASMLGFVGKLHLYADRIAREQKPELVICSSTYPLDIYPGARIARSANARLIFEVHDLWPLTPILLGGYSPRHPYIRVLQRAEDYAYRNAAMVISILPDALGHMVGRGLAPEKFMHVPNGVPIGRGDRAEDRQLPLRLEQLIADERRRQRFLIAFAGGINSSNAVETLVDAARLLAARDVSFLIAGDGPRADELRDRASRHGLDNCHFVGRIPKPAIQRFLSRVDALAAPLYNSPLYRFGTSLNKLFDYMLAAKPILQASDASNDLVGEAGCGYTVTAGDPAAFAEAVLRLRALSPDQRRRLGENGRDYVVKHHDYRVLARRFLDAAAGRLPELSPAARRWDLAYATGSAA
jgi:glycosyltransferase involved in cell wall biosynthesis